MQASTTTDRPDRQQIAGDLPIALALMAFLLSIYLLTYSGVPHNPDEWFYLAGTHSALTGDWRGLQSHGWLFSLLAAPFYAAAMFIPGLGSFQVASLLNSVITALTAAILFLALQELKLPRGLRTVTALIFGLGTLAWPYSRYLFREPAAGLFLLLAVWGTMRFSQQRRPAALIGACIACACAVAVKFTLLAFVPFLALPVVLALAWPWLRGLTRRGWTIVGAIVVALTVAAIWSIRYVPQLARVIPHYVWQAPDLGAFVALWVSPGWGLLLYVPALTFALIGSVAFVRRAPAIAFIALGGSLFYILESTTNPFWWGYWAFGPRQLVPLLPLLCLPIPFGLRWLRSRWGGLGRAGAGLIVGLSVCVQLIGVLTPFNQFARQTFLGADLSGPAITWRWDLWPLAGMARFLRPELLDIAWLAGRDTGVIQFRWSILAVLVAMTVFAGGWLWLLARRDRAFRGPGGAWLSLALCLACVPIALWAVRGVYLDERYRPALGYPAAAQMVREARRVGDLLVTDLWTENLTDPTVAMLNYCRGGCPPRLDLVRENLVNRETDWQRTRLADLAGHRRAWLVLERVAEGDPNSIVERWLGQVGYLERCQWAGPQVRLCLYGLGPGAPLGGGSAGGIFGDALRLRSAEISLTSGNGSGGVPIRSGDQLLVNLAWETVGAPAADYVASLQLLGPDGRLAAGADVPPGNGFRPTSTWRAGERLADRRALTIPDSAGAGRYSLSLIVYDPVNGQRLPVRSADGRVGDMLPLVTVEVGP